jgi:DNA-binding NarL/FixJ family response regulator
MKPIRVALHADDPLSRVGLVHLLTAGPSSRLQLAAERSEGDILIVSIKDMHAVALRQLRECAAESGKPLVLICDRLAQSALIAAISCRVVAILPRRSITPALLERTVSVVAEGGGVMSPELVGSLLEHVSELRRQVRRLKGASTFGFTDREIDVLRLVADGLVTEEIAIKLCLSERTVKNVLHTAMRRHGLRNRSHAVAYALRCGLI